jgi:hypothetical protein
MKVFCYMQNVTHYDGGDAPLGAAGAGGAGIAAIVGAEPN